MSGLTLKPILGCNFSCTGCYEGQIFKRNSNKPEPYDLEKIIEAMRNGPGGGATLHGGEIGLMPVGDQRILCQAAKDQGRPISCQTNGSILTDKLLEMYTEYGVAVGVSLNGPDVLNRDRKVLNAGGHEITDKMTERIHANIRKMRGAGVSVSLITVLSTTNAGTPELVQRLITWSEEMEDQGIWWHRWNPLHYDDGADCISGAPTTQLRVDQLTEAWVTLSDACHADKRRMWDPFREFMDNLWGLGVQPCWMGECDVFSTDAVYAILHDGSVGNCLRTAKDGIPYQRTPEVLHTRQAILKQTDCKGCRYFDMCHGGCPAEAVDGDWRNKSRFCQSYIDLYAHLESKITGLLPNFTSRPDWTSNNPDELQQSCSNRAPLISPVNPMSVAWSKKPSTFTGEAREAR